MVDGLTKNSLSCAALDAGVLTRRPLIIASNRGPVTFTEDEAGELHAQRGGGGLVTALSGLAEYAEVCWIACAQSEADQRWTGEFVPVSEIGQNVAVKFLSPPPAAYDGYYNVISNPLLWFLQHSMWDMVRAPTINYLTWQAWEHGYVAVNRLFAEAIAEEVKASSNPAIVMLQDYHLYLTPRLLREALQREPSKAEKGPTLIHFIHIPWPGTEDWGILPPKMRLAILEGLCCVDLLGFQTREDGLNFIRTCESHLPGAQVNFKSGWVWYQNHQTHVRDFPISIDVPALHRLAESEEVHRHHAQLQQRFGDRKLILRIDRTEPSKNIVRGFQAFDEMLTLHPEHCGEVQFLALFVPSRLEVEEYQDYLDELMAAAGRVNARYGTSDWEPVRVLVGEDYARAVAALKMYDVLLVNSIADGMNLVAKEGPTVNEKNGVVVLSERTGARQQLEPGALVISPCDVYATAEALHQGLTMAEEIRRTWADRLRNTIEREDIRDWLCRQLEEVEALNL